MGADLVMEQRLDAVRPERGRLRDEQSAERHHQVGDVLAHLDMRGKVRIHSTVAVELHTRGVREHTGGDARCGGRLGRDRLEQLLGGGRERPGNPSVELQRRVEEPRGVAILQGGDLSDYLVSLRPEKGVQRRVGHVLDLEVVEVAAHQIRLEIQWPQPKSGDGPEVTPLEVRPCLRCIDRRGVEQQVHAALDLCEAGVDLEGRRQILAGSSMPRKYPPTATSNLPRAGPIAGQGEDRTSRRWLRWSKPAP